MFDRLGDTGSSLWPGHIGEFETDRREPNLLVILAYGRVISTTGGGELLEMLLDDELDLPDRLPADPKKLTIKRKSPSISKRKR
jgi:hypothetical protein